MPLAAPSWRGQRPGRSSPKSNENRPSLVDRTGVNSAISAPSRGAVQKRHIVVLFRLWVNAAASDTRRPQHGFWLRAATEAGGPGERVGTGSPAQQGPSRRCRPDSPGQKLGEEQNCRSRRQSQRREVSGGFRSDDQRSRWASPFSRGAEALRNSIGVRPPNSVPRVGGAPTNAAGL